MKKKLLFSLFGMLAVVSLVYATKFTGLENSSEYQLWNMLEPYEIAEAVGYNSEDGTNASEAQSALDAAILSFVTVDEYDKTWTKARVDKLIEQANLAKNYISINQYKLANADALAGWEDGALTSKDFDKVHAAKEAYGKVDDENSIEALTLGKTWEDYLPGLGTAINKLDNDLSKELDAAWTKFLKLYPRLSKITEGYINDANEQIPGRELKLSSKGHNIDLNKLETDEEENSDYKLLKDFNKVATLIGTSEHYKSLVNDKYSWNATETYCKEYKNMEEARVLLYNYRAVNKYCLSLDKIKEAVVVKSTIKDNIGKIYAFYAQANEENGAYLLDEGVRNYVYQVFPAEEIDDFYQAALQMYKDAERTTMSMEIAKAVIEKYKGTTEAPGILSKTTDTVVAADKEVATEEGDITKIGSARNEIAGLYDKTTTPATTTLAENKYEFTEITYTDENGKAFTNSAVKYFSGKDLVDLGMSTQWRLEKEQEVLVSDKIAAAYLTELYKAASMDEVEMALVEAYKKIYAEQIAQTTVAKTDKDVLANALNDLTKLGYESYSAYGVAGKTIDGVEYKMTTLKYLEWDATTETFKKVATDYTAETTALINGAKTKLNAYLNAQSHGNIAAKAAAANWKNDWEAKLEAIVNVTPEDKQNLIDAEEAYNKLDPKKAKDYINYEVMFAKLIDIVPTEVENFGILFGDGTWCALDVTETTFPGTYPTATYDNKVPSSWKDIDAYVKAVRALEVAATIKTTNGTTVTEKEMSTDYLANAVAFVWGTSLDINATKLASVFAEIPNVVIVDSWKTLDARANKITYNSNKPFMTPIKLHANTVEVSKAGQKIVEDYWQSLYLPFNLTGKNLTEVNKAGADVYYLAGATQKEAEDGVELNFGFRKKTSNDVKTYTDAELAAITDPDEKAEAEKVNNVATWAYMPYLIKGTQADKLTLTDVNIQITPAGGEGSIEVNAGKSKYTFVSSSQPIEIKANNYFLARKSGKTAIWLADKDREAPAPASTLVVRATDNPIYYVIGVTEILDGEETTGIETIETEKMPVEGIYTISGVKVNNANKPGLYIINGKKVMVK